MQKNHHGEVHNPDKCLHLGSSVPYEVTGGGASIVSHAGVCLGSPHAQHLGDTQMTKCAGAVPGQHDGDRSRRYTRDRDPGTMMEGGGVLLYKALSLKSQDAMEGSPQTLEGRQLQAEGRNKATRQAAPGMAQHVRESLEGMQTTAGPTRAAEKGRRHRDGVQHSMDQRPEQGWRPDEELGTGRAPGPC